MEREIRAGLGLAFIIAILVLLFIGLVRFLIPMILEARFHGSVLLASVVGIFGVLGLLWLAVILLGQFARSVKNQPKGDE